MTLDSPAYKEQLETFYDDIVMDVIYNYFEIKILNNVPFNIFLETNLHVLFHKYIPTTPCCICLQNSLAAPGKRKTLEDVQFNLLFESVNAAISGHEVHQGSAIKIHCLCKYTTNKETVETGIVILDICLMCNLIKSCCASSPGNPKWLEDIRDTRNSISHLGSDEILTKEYADKKWAILESSVLNLAGTIGQAYQHRLKRRISSLKSHNSKLEEFARMVSSEVHNRMASAFRNHFEQIEKMLSANFQSNNAQTAQAVGENQETSNQTDVIKTGEDDENVSSVHDGLTGNAEVLYEVDPGSDYEEEKYTKEAPEKDQRKRMEIQLRGYQFELAEKAVDGKNTVICADIGSGKTWVALHIVREHLNKRGRGKAKVAFMARTNLLVRQQFTLFKHYFEKDSVYTINKDEKTNTPLKKLIQQYDVFFFTPQILINNIDKGETRISDFTLLILDECHHTHKGEPHNNLMRKYIKTKHSNPEVRLPQIVGMTASVGVGQATTEDDAIGHMVKIFSNLDLNEISTVENPHHKAEMKQYVPIPSEEHVKMKADYVDQCNTIIIEEIDKIVERYENILKNKPVPNTCYNLPGGDYLSKTCLGSIITLKNQLMCDVTLEFNGREMISCLSHLSILHEAVDMKYLMNVEHVVQFLDKKYQEEEQQEERLIQIDNRLLRQGQELIRRLQTQPDIKPNPNLRMIEEKLQELFAEAGENSLGMVFVQTRATAKSLAEYLDKKLEAIHIPVKPFIGSKAADSGDGLTETEKKELLDEFRNHKIKLLVATSVGSEGIDVPECNIVMKYNYSGNEINIIQMRGRTRKAGGQAIYISDHNVLRRDLIGIEKAALMHKALNQLKEKGPEELRRLIDTEQTNSLKELEEEERKNRHLQNAKRTCSFKLVCARCKDTEIDGRSIRLFKQNHHVVADRGFLDRVKKKDIKEVTKVNQMIKKSEIFCKKCPQKLGKIFLIHGLEVPLLKIEAFLCQEGDKLRKYKNWKLVPFKIDEINHKDLEAVFPKPILTEVVVV